MKNSAPGPDVPQELLRYLQDGKCVLFAGAGISMSAGLPDWRGLVEQLLSALPDQIDPATRRALNVHLDAGDFLAVAGYCQRKLDPLNYQGVLRNAIARNGPRLPLRRLHELIVDLPFRSIVTTNYDRVLETAFSRYRRFVPTVVTGNEPQLLGTLLFSESEVFIVKAHGCIDRTPGRLILTAADYREHIHSNPAFRAFFNAMLLNYAILFVGYSHRDPDFQLLLDKQFVEFEGFTPPRYALMSDVDAAQVEFLFQSNITVIPYRRDASGADQHQPLTAFFEGVKSAIDHQQPLTRSRDSFRVIAGLDDDAADQYTIGFTHKGTQTHHHGSFDSYRMPGFPPDEAEIVVRIWNLAAMCVGRGWPNVHMVCGCSTSPELVQHPMCIVGSPSGNPFSRRLFERLADLSQTERARAGTATPHCPTMILEEFDAPDGPRRTFCIIVDDSGTRYIPSRDTYDPERPEDPKQRLVDYALLLVVPNVLGGHPRQRIVLLAGCRVGGQVGINRWFTDFRTLSELDRNYQGESFYALLEIAYRFVPDNQLPHIIQTIVLQHKKVWPA